MTSMNYVLRAGFLVFLAVIFACQQDISNPSNRKSNVDSTNVSASKIQVSSSGNGEVLDSLKAERLLKMALITAKENSSKEKFLYENDSLKISIGAFFTKSKKHLLIRTTANWYVRLYIYDITDDFQKMLYIQEPVLDYLGDTLLDVNGDGHKDLLYHWYPPSGCCLRHKYYVYLYKPKENIFTDHYTFINPTFHTKEKTIRGISYGHPGQVSLYKYRWNNYQVDTIEYIFPNPDSRNFYIRKKHYNFKEKGQKLKAVPKEYLEIKDYDRFQQH